LLYSCLTTNIYSTVEMLKNSSPWRTRSRTILLLCSSGWKTLELSKSFGDSHGNIKPYSIYFIFFTKSRPFLVDKTPFKNVLSRTQWFIIAFELKDGRSVSHPIISYVTFSHLDWFHCHLPIGERRYILISKCFSSRRTHSDFDCFWRLYIIR